MLFYLNAQGVVVAAIPSPVNQGSVGVNEILLIAPFPSTTVVSATFTLPNGIKLYPKYVGLDEDGKLKDGEYGYVMAVAAELPTPDGQTLNVWRLTLDRALTQVSGNVTVQFLLTGIDGTLSSSNTAFNVGKGVMYLNPSATTEELNSIAAYLNRALQAAQTAEEAQTAAEGAQTAAEEAQTAAEEARTGAEKAETKAKAHAKLYEDILPRLEYDHVITTKEQLSTLPDRKGRVLIDIKESIVLDELLELKVKASLLHIANLVISGNELKLNGNAGEIKNVGFTDAVLSLTGFIAVSGFLNNVIDLTSCYNITNSCIRNASECRFIDNCYADDSGDAKFYKCEFICGIRYFALTSGITRFLECAYLSNVLCEGVYDNCTYVDAETCRGFVPAEDYGKVQTLTDDGTCEIKTLPQIITASVDENYVLTVKLFDGNKEVEISSAEIDLPLEEMVVDASVSDDGSKLILELKNGNTVEIPVESIVSGLATKDYVNDAVVPKLAYDHVITTLEQFKNLADYDGRVLVKGDFSISDEALSLAFKGILLDFCGTFSIGESVTFTLDGSNSAEIQGLKTKFEGYYSTVCLKNFVRVTNVQSGFVTSYQDFSLTNCMHISKSTFASAYNCSYMDNCVIQSIDNSTVSYCKFICGITTAYQVTFKNCSFISNVASDSAYEDCTYVDAETCMGFVADENVGKVQTITKDGSFETFDPSSKVSITERAGTQVYASNNGNQVSIQATSSSVTPTDGVSGAVIPIRTSDGNLLAPTVDKLKDGNYFTSQEKVAALLADIMSATIYGDDMPVGNERDNAIELAEYGLFIVKGEDVNVSYTANGAMQAVTSDFHLFVKYSSTSGVNKIIHIYQTGVFEGYIKSFDGTLNTGIYVHNLSVNYGCRVIKMRMKSVTK